MSPLRIVIDSNVIVSAFLFGGPPRRVLESVIAGRSLCFISLAILDEVRDVLQRPKFGLTPDQALAIVEELHALCRVVTPSGTVDAIQADPDDNRVLECALAAEARFIVSGDAHLLKLGRWRDIVIQSPADFARSFDQATRQD